MNKASGSTRSSQSLHVSERNAFTTKSKLRRFAPLAATCMFCGLLCMQGSLVAQTSEAAPAFQPNPAAGAGSVIVHPQFGGIIFGFDIDPAGREGILSEAFQHPDGTITAAVETFDTNTGRIIKVVAKTETKDDFVTLAISGTSVALVEREHVVSIFNVLRSYSLLNPVGSNKITGKWTPPIDQRHVINEISRVDGNPTVAVYAADTSTNMQPLVFSSNVAANTFGNTFAVLDSDFNFEQPPELAYNNVTNQAVLGHQKNFPFIVPPMIGQMDLTTGTFSKFSGLGLGVINGIAVDSEDGIACTTTSFDAAVQFYTLSTKKGVSVALPGSPNNSLFAGQHIAYDSLNKLFLVAQPFSSTGAGSSIQVYDTKGNFVESVNGLSFSGESNVIPVHIAISPSKRTGFVDGPNTDDTEIQSFSY
jgi:hypothetical protein